MSEASKTAVFVATALIVAGVAYFSRPGANAYDADRGDAIGNLLVDNLEVQDIRRLRVVRFDESTSRATEFEVANEGGLWSIPSKFGYPADASDQLADVADTVLGKKILRKEGDNARLHEERGLLDPASSERQLGDKGVGTRLTMVDVKGEPLADLIIGNKVDEDGSQHYVRYADQDLVYVSDVDPEKLSTKFEDWIEDDLLKLDSFSIRKVLLKDYSFEVVTVLGPQGFVGEPDWDRRARMALRYNNSDAKWEPEKIEVFDKDALEYVEQTIAENEQVDDGVLNDLKNALDDLKIVDVEKKPEGLSNDLKMAQEFLRSQEALQSLLVKGYFPVRMTENDYEILSSEGEVVCTLDTGVEYILRFGKLQMSSDEAIGNTEQDAGEETSVEGGDESQTKGINRYLFVMAQFNESMIERPELEEEPPLPPGTEEAEAEGEQQSNAERKVPTQVVATGGQDQDDSDAATESEGEAGSDSDVAEAASDARDASPDEAAGEESGGTTPTADAETEQGDASSSLDDIMARRKTIRDENKRKMDEYDRKLKEGREKVEELNLRFGDWYYVISNETYQKIHLSLDQVIVPKEEEEGTENGSAASGAEPVGQFGLPGQAIPNLPPVGLDSTTDDTSTETPEADSRPAETPADETTPDEPTPDESAAGDAGADAPVGDGTAADETPGDESVPAETATSDEGR